MTNPKKLYDLKCLKMSSTYTVIQKQPLGFFFNCQNFETWCNFEDVAYITLHTCSHFFGKKEPFLRFVSQEKKLTTPGCGRFFAIFQWKKVLITLEKFILIDASRIYALGKLIKRINVSENSSFLCFASFWKIHNINLKQNIFFSNFSCRFLNPNNFFQFQL